MCWNIDGLLAKIPDTDFMHYIRRFDICSLVETFTHVALDFSTSFGDFLVMHSPGVKLSTQGRLSGGVVVLIKNCFANQINRLAATGDNIIAFKILTTNTIVICTYIPPFDSPYYSNKDTPSSWSLIEDLILNIQEKHPQAVILLCGDLNARIGKWDLHTDEEDFFRTEQELGKSCACNVTSSRQSQDDKTNSFGRILKNLCRIHHISLLNGCTKGDKTGQFTYISPQGNSVIDYGLVIAQQMPYNIDLVVGSRIESNHMPIEINIGHPKKANYDHETRTYTKISWDPSKTEDFKKQIQTEEFQQQVISTCKAIGTSCNVAISMFNQAIIQCAECMKKEVKVRGKPASQIHAHSSWFDQECRAHKRLAMKALRQYKIGKQEEQKLKYLQARNSYKTMTREKKKNYFADIHRTLTNNARDSNAFWSIIRNVSQKKANDPNIDINKWKQHFTNLLQAKETNTKTTPVIRGDIYNEILDSPISPVEVRTAIHNLRASKAPGIDSIPGGCIKEAGESIIPFLTKLFNAIYDLHDFPEIWSHSVIVPIHKKGDTSNTDNYRGISLLCALGKVFTAILAKRLRVWMERENKLCMEQAGFRANCSTVDHIFTLQAIISKYVYGDRRGKLYVGFIDYHKAFDSVDRKKLWEILSDTGVSSKFLIMLQSMYCKVQSCVRWQHDLSAILSYRRPKTMRHRELFPL